MTKTGDKSDGALSEPDVFGRLDVMTFADAFPLVRIRGRCPECFTTVKPDATGRELRTFSADGF